MMILTISCVKKTIWPSHVTIEATNTKGQTHERAYLYRNNLKEKVHGNKPSAKTHGKITQVRYGKGKTVVTWYGLTVETRDIPLLGLKEQLELFNIKWTKKSNANQSINRKVDHATNRRIQRLV